MVDDNSHCARTNCDVYGARPIRRKIRFRRDTGGWMVAKDGRSFSVFVSTSNRADTRTSVAVIPVRLSDCVPVRRLRCVPKVER